MDNIKIEIIGTGAKLTVGELTTRQANYIMSNQTECNTVIPLFNNDYTFTYKNWNDLDDVCNMFGSSYEIRSGILLTVNGVTNVIDNFNEERSFVNIINDKNYMLSISHIYGNISTFEFSVENFDEAKLTFLVNDLNSLLWGEIISGIKYDSIVQHSVSSETTETEFENILYRNGTIMPIQTV